MSITSDESAVVGITATCERLREFRGPTALKDAEKYVGTLPNVEEGIYYIDWPYSRVKGND